MDGGISGPKLWTATAGVAATVERQERLKRTT